ncbi:MAG: hypothetical protein A3B89_02655 [Candidatus Buchananbacteria bacterium RIFCSPHIGHO2_02_FULL_40_13]|uniref:Glutamyl-tRNA amidotransferase n=1 Tax=Candidatus Buchananbacteria bacterium RIFCSPLOWO2_01_FULL_39_33 TaxID=1797543 RepID=A0A1G1YHW0_9BACT|nr:MAG: hypothetical protein A2820_02340 [Candidatus Buchananbacteria bacterium RIFCSPHIGHO2_01_FULL_40_35]OGY49911.1 MAG: hypothetical protein A3B89_02655 [Candidatus Buchananbacteria bacterium RIFCSPHIGHO2_02_FULL_40_13]OGY51948.1 MAG: hypothetical protein A3A02_01425 [Candidatus Buchananbacteria bacterium RIFCSPLOWO2_01_FULL_39_33]
MPLAKQINNDFLTAFKNKQDTTVSVLRLLKAALTNKEIEKKLPKGENLADDDILAVIKSEVKKRKDSIEAFKQGHRDDLVQKEEKELAILERYLPKQLSEEPIREIVKKVISGIGATALADFGRVMGLVMLQIQGRADGQVVSKIVKEEMGK